MCILDNCNFYCLRKYSISSSCNTKTKKKGRDYSGIRVVIAECEYCEKKIIRKMKDKSMINIWYICEMIIYMCVHIAVLHFSSLKFAKWVITQELWREKLGYYECLFTRLSVTLRRDSKRSLSSLSSLYVCPIPPHRLTSLAWIPSGQLPAVRRQMSLRWEFAR